MSWIRAFELMCYAIVVVKLTDLIHKKDFNSLFTFGSAALVGFVMELLDRLRHQAGIEAEVEQKTQKKWEKRYFFSVSPTFVCGGKCRYF